jgi:uncharacterized protein (TIGR02466 family)
MAIEGWFSTPIYHSMVEDPEFTQIQSDFAKVVDSLNQQDAFQYNPGWLPNTHKLSDITFTKNLIEEYNLNAFAQELLKHVSLYTQQLGCPPNKVSEFKITQSWMTNTGPGNYAHTHNHGSADISGVYYYKTNGQDGSINFMSPVSQFSTYMLEHLPNNVSYPPQEGKIILFPGWLDHGVPENKTSDDRISVSFNISFRRPEF